MNPAYRYEATLVKVVDGDTVDLDVALGYYVTARIRFRLDGLDAPEMRAPGPEGEDAKEWLVNELVAQRLIVVSRKTEKFGRWLGTLYTDDDTVSVNDRMLEAGHARPYAGGARG